MRDMRAPSSSISNPGLFGSLPRSPGISPIRSQLSPLLLDMLPVQTRGYASRHADEHQRADGEDAGNESNHEPCDEDHVGISSRIARWLSPMNTPPHVLGGMYCGWPLFSHTLTGFSTSGPFFCFTYVVTGFPSLSSLGFSS